MSTVGYRKKGGGVWGANYLKVWGKTTIMLEHTEASFIPYVSKFQF